MAEEEKNEEGNEEVVEGAEGEEGEGEEGGSKKKLIIMVAAVVLVLALGGAGLMFSGVFSGGGSGEDEAELDPQTVPQITYYELDEFLVNLNNPDKKVSFLKMVITLELPNLATQAEVESKIPRIRDSFQVYLRELRNTDLRGSAGIQRLREELMLRINKVIDPLTINDVLFKEIIVQ